MAAANRNSSHIMVAWKYDTPILPVVNHHVACFNCHLWFYRKLYLILSHGHEVSNVMRLPPRRHREWTTITSKGETRFVTRIGILNSQTHPVEYYLITGILDCTIINKCKLRISKPWFRKIRGVLPK